jgi:hypothetical protein
MVYNIGVKRERNGGLNLMKTYKILRNNKTYLVTDLAVAHKVAKNETLVGGRATILDGNTKVATYLNGEKIF